MMPGDEYTIHNNFWDDKGLLHSATHTVRILSLDLNSNRVEFAYGASPSYGARASVFISSCTLITTRANAGAGTHIFSLPPSVHLQEYANQWSDVAETVPAMNIGSSIKCECGSHSVGIDKHSDYCPRHTKS